MKRYDFDGLKDDMKQEKLIEQEINTAEGILASMPSDPWADPESIEWLNSQLQRGRKHKK